MALFKQNHHKRYFPPSKIFHRYTRNYKRSDIFVKQQNVNMNDDARSVSERNYLQRMREHVLS